MLFVSHDFTHFSQRTDDPVILSKRNEIKNALQNIDASKRNLITWLNLPP